jgi:Rrf2 family protein
MSVGVEWALHCCVNLAVLGEEATVSAARLAALNDLPTAYLVKHMQALARAGIVHSVSGPGGGFRLARDPSLITVLDVVVAVEGTEPAFRCSEIRGQGQAGKWGANRAMCTVEVAMRRGELAWRRALAAQTVDDVATSFLGQHPEIRGRLAEFLGTGTT